MRWKIVVSIQSPNVKLKMQEVVFRKTNLAPAFPTEKFEQGLLELGLSAGDIWSLLTISGFPQFPSNQTNFVKSTNMLAAFSTIRSARNTLPLSLK
jgi:hypothetical protein